MEKSKWACNQRLADSREGTNLSFERDRAHGFSWPQKNYRCSFCNKEFKSAQALGGHMNVHRRDRARMRLSPSWDPPNPNPNSSPNPNPSLSLSSSQLPSAATCLPCNVECLHSVISSPSPPSLQEDEFLAMGRCRPSPPSLQEDEFLAMGRCRSLLCREGEDLGMKKREGAMLEFTNFATRKDVIRLDLSLGLIQDVKEDSDSDSDLDLELRLGYS